MQKPQALPAVWPATQVRMLVSGNAVAGGTPPSRLADEPSCAVTGAAVPGGASAQPRHSGVRVPSWGVA